MITTNALLASLVMSGIQSPAQPISLNFSQTEVGQVFRAIGLRTGANIVYAAGDKVPVTLHLEAKSVEEAVRGAAASASLSYRKTGRFFVVARPEAMAQALEPFAQNLKIEAPGNAEELAKRLQAALPYARVTPNGRYLLISGIPEDISIARELISDRKDELMPHVSTTKVSKLKSAPTGKVSQVIKDLYPNVNAVVITEDKTGGGTMTFSGNELEVNKAVAQAEQLDEIASVPIAEEEYRVYEIRYSAANMLKSFLAEAMPNVQAMIAPSAISPDPINFKSITGTGFVQAVGGQGGGGGQTQATSTGNNDMVLGTGTGVTDNSGRARRLVLRGQRSDIDSAIALLSQIDVKPQQVKVDVQVIDASPTDLASTGIDWSWTPWQLEEAAPGTGFTGNTGSATPWESGITNPVGFGMWSRIPFRIAAAIQGLVTKKQAKLLANPSVQVLENDDANIFIGDTIRTRLAVAGGLGTQTVQVAEFNVGIILLLRPRVNSDGNITMRVHPVVSTVSGIVNDLPQTSSREAETTVMVKDGETMVIGGLIRDEEIKTMREVPILSQLPFFGELFKSRSTEKRKSNVLVMITPRIVRDEVAEVTPQPMEKAQ